MSRIYLIYLILIYSQVSAVIFDNDQTTRITRFVEDVMDCQHIPGLTLAVVKGDETWTKGFGTADRERRVYVTSDTLFGIASVTKAFTATLLAMMFNDTNGLTWTSKVSDILGPDFAFIDEERTRELTLRDLLTHRTGLSSADITLLSGFSHSYSREELTKRFRFLPEVKPFRDAWEYNNYGYVLVGHIVEVLSGESYEDTLEKRIFQPLGMNTSRILGHNITTDDDGMAKPYFLIENQLQLTDAAIYDDHLGEPAGAIASSAKDMTKWLQFLLREGKTSNNETLVSSKVLVEGFETHESVSSAIESTSLYTPTFPASDVQVGYGYGWFTAVYKGYKKVWHSGGAFTYLTQLTFYPDLDFGIFTSINGAGVGNAYAEALATYFISDLLIGDEPWLNSSTACTFPSPWKEVSPSPISDTGVTNEVVDCIPCYLGKYGHQFYGDLEVKVNPQSGSSLILEDRILVGSLNSTKNNTIFKLDAWEPYRLFSHPGNRTVLIDVSFSGLENNQYQMISLSILKRSFTFSRNFRFSDEIENTKTVTTKTVTTESKIACGQNNLSSSQMFIRFMLVLSVFCNSFL